METPVRRPRRFPFLRGLVTGVALTLVTLATGTAWFLVQGHQSGKLVLSIGPSISTVTVIESPSAYDRQLAQNAMRDAAISTKGALETPDIVERTLMMMSLQEGMDFTAKLMAARRLAFYLHRPLLNSQPLPEKQEPLTPKEKRL